MSRVSPLALLVATLPAMIGVLFTRDVQRPAVFAAVAVVVLALSPGVSAKAKWRGLVVLLIALPIMTGVLMLVTDPARVPEGVTVAERAVATALRIAALTTLSMLTGVGVGVDRLGRALVQQARLPARHGYVLRLSARMLPRLQHELATIRTTRRARGTTTGRLRSSAGMVVPLAASHVRHAERVALAMDARGFVDARGRTERAQERWRWTDTILVFLAWALTTAIFVCLPR
ncbi:MAG: energy-coupling factor transporter transmembrane component T [Aeromicrobium sp.]|uniref:energy-coupling factor transporter transmembrane component T family protein n=1 Tax=Aeromicrobium sp. TaxID=1871063 RepID=UPI0039E6555E